LNTRSLICFLFSIIVISNFSGNILNGQEKAGIQDRLTLHQILQNDQTLFKELTKDLFLHSGTGFALFGVKAMAIQNYRIWPVIDHRFSPEHCDYFTISQERRVEIFKKYYRLFSSANFLMKFSKITPGSWKPFHGEGYELQFIHKEKFIE